VRRSLPSEDTEIKVVDYLGFGWNCSFQIVEEDNGLVCKIGGQWVALCRARRLGANNPLKLAVTQVSDNKIIYLRYVRIPCKHRDIIKPLDKVVCLDAAEAGSPQQVWI